MGLSSEFSRTMATYPSETYPGTLPPASSNNSARPLATVRSVEEDLGSDMEMGDKEERFAAAGGVWCKTEVLVESEPYNIGRAV